jgi:hypothetical protein
MAKNPGRGQGPSRTVVPLIMMVVEVMIKSSSNADSVRAAQRTLHSIKKPIGEFFAGK